LVRLERGEAYEVDAGDTPPMTDGGKANEPELQAYSSGKTTQTAVPITDEFGTYLAAYTPLLKNGRIIGLLAAQFDSAPLSDFQGIVRRAFWVAILPGIAASLVVAYLLAGMFMEPMQVLRALDETAQAQRANDEDDPWRNFTTREQEIADLLGRGVERIKDLAQALSLSPETITTYLKRIKAKTGWSKQRLAMEAAARRRG
jgi:DNA-binding CsgD family transcriptional regulator